MDGVSQIDFYRFNTDAGIKEAFMETFLDLPTMSCASDNKTSKPSAARSYVKNFEDTRLNPPQNISRKYRHWQVGCYLILYMSLSSLTNFLSKLQDWISYQCNGTCRSACINFVLCMTSQ